MVACADQNRSNRHEMHIPDSCPGCAGRTGAVDAWRALAQRGGPDAARLGIARFERTRLELARLELARVRGRDGGGRRGVAARPAARSVRRPDLVGPASHGGDPQGAAGRDRGDPAGGQAGGRECDLDSRLLGLGRRNGGLPVGQWRVADPARGSPLGAGLLDAGRGRLSMDLGFLGAFGGSRGPLLADASRDARNWADQPPADDESLLGQRLLAVPRHRLRVASRILAHVLRRLGVGACPLRLDTSRRGVQRGVLGLSVGAARRVVRPGLFPPADLSPQRILLLAARGDRHPAFGLAPVRLSAPLALLLGRLLRLPPPRRPRLCAVAQLSWPARLRSGLRLLFGELPADEHRLCPTAPRLARLLPATRAVSAGPHPAGPSPAGGARA